MAPSLLVSRLASNSCHVGSDTCLPGSFSGVLNPAIYTESPTTTGVHFISLGNPRTHQTASPSRAEYTSMRKLAGARINDGRPATFTKAGVDAPLSASGRGFCQRILPSL